MGDYARALTDGVVGNEQLVGTLAETIADRVVVKMTTNLTQQRSEPQAMKSMRSPGFEPGLQAWRAYVLDQTGRRPHDFETSSVAF